MKPKLKSAQHLGQLGGSVSSAAKTQAVRANGKRGGRPTRCQCGEVTGAPCNWVGPGGQLVSVRTEVGTIRVSPGCAAILAQLVRPGGE